MKKNSTYVHKPGEKYIVIQKSELEKYLAEGYIHGTGKSKDEYRKAYTKCAETIKRRYGVDSPWQIPHVEAARQTDETKQKRVASRQKTYKEKYGVINNSQLPDYIEKVRQTNIEKYGSVEASYALRQEKLKQTSLERYGTEHPMQCEQIKDRLKETFFLKYGVENYAQTSEYHQKARKRYEYDNQRFDSIPELALYVYTKDHNEAIERNTTIKFKYIYEDKIHYFIPDFIYKGKIIEIKGDHFFEDGKMINPFDRTQDGLYQAKYKCGLDNGVEFWQSADYMFAVNHLYNKENIECYIQSPRI